MIELEHAWSEMQHIAVDVRNIVWCELIPVVASRGSYSQDIVAVVKFGIPCGKNGFYERTLEYKTLEAAESMFKFLVNAGAAS